MNYFKDNENKVFMFDNEQIAIIDIINTPDFDNAKEKIPAIFFEINEKIKSMRKMTQSEINAHINPQMTKEQLIEQEDAQKQILIAEVHTETEMLRTKLALKRIKPDEEALLIAWLDYLDLLEAMDTSTAPIIDWPQKPI